MNRQRLRLGPESIIIAFISGGAALSGSLGAAYFNYIQNKQVVVQQQAEECIKSIEAKDLIIRQRTEDVVVALTDYGYRYDLGALPGRNEIVGIFATLNRLSMYLQPGMPYTERTSELSASLQQYIERIMERPSVSEVDKALSNYRKISQEWTISFNAYMENVDKEKQRCLGSP